MLVLVCFHVRPKNVHLLLLHRSTSPRLIHSVTPGFIPRLVEDLEISLYEDSDQPLVPKEATLQRAIHHQIAG